MKKKLVVALRAWKFCFGRQDGSSSSDFLHIFWTLKIDTSSWSSEQKRGMFPRYICYSTWYWIRRTRRARCSYVNSPFFLLNLLQEIPPKRRNRRRLTSGVRERQMLQKLCWIYRIVVVEVVVVESSPTEWTTDLVTRGLLRLDSTCLGHCFFGGPSLEAHTSTYSKPSPLTVSLHKYSGRCWRSMLDQRTLRRPWPYANLCIFQTHFAWKSEVVGSSRNQGQSWELILSYLAIIHQQRQAGHDVQSRLFYTGKRYICTSWVSCYSSSEALRVPAHCSSQSLT